MPNLYSDEEEAAPASPTDPSNPEDDAGAEDQPTFLVPKSAFGGRDVEAGATETIKIVRTMDDQVEAVCVSDYEDEEEEEAAPVIEEEVPAGDAAMRSYME